MRKIACLTCAILVVAITAAADDAPDAPKLQGMTLRLELFVTDMHKSIDFYTNVLGFERIKGEPDYAPVRSGSVLMGRQQVYPRSTISIPKFRTVAVDWASRSFWKWAT